MLELSMMLAKLKLNQWKSEDEFKLIQEQKFKELFSYAKAHSPYYRKTLKDCTFSSLEDLPNLPLTMKKPLQSSPDEFLSSKFTKKSLIKSSSSGSTGAPVDIYHDKSEAHFGPGFELHQFTEAGVTPFDSQIRITHNDYKQNFLQKLGIFRRKHLPFSNSPKKNLQIIKHGPKKVLIGFTSVLLPLARANLETRAKAKIVFTSGEVLSESDRKLISESFSCPVRDMYGCVETSWIAWECEEGNMHLFSDYLTAEIVDDQYRPTKGYGNIVVTPLWKRSMPLIRYFLTDQTAIAKRCKCGRGSTVIKPIIGRDDDFIVLKNGSKLSPAVISCALNDVKVKEYQIVQNAIDDFVFKYVPANGLNIANLKEIFKDQIGDAHIEFEELEKISCTKTGKRKKIITRI